VTVTTPLLGTIVVRRLGLAMFNSHIKFEMSTITCNEKMKGNAKCKKFCFEPPFGDLGVTYTVHLMLAGKRVVDFLLVLIDFFASFHGCGTIKRNLSKSAFSDWGGSLWAQILGRLGRRPQSVYGPLDRGMTLPLEVFTRRNFAADFFWQNL